MTTLTKTTRIAAAAHVLGRLAGAWHAWRLERQTQRALERLSDEQLKDIGFRRGPGYPPYYDRIW